MGDEGLGNNPAIQKDNGTQWIPKTDQMKAAVKERALRLHGEAVTIQPITLAGDYWIEKGYATSASGCHPLNRRFGSGQCGGDVNRDSVRSGTCDHGLVSSPRRSWECFAVFS
jgi:hypothetical protein